MLDSRVLVGLVLLGACNGGDPKDTDDPDDTVDTTDTTNTTDTVVDTDLPPQLPPPPILSGSVAEDGEDRPGVSISALGESAISDLSGRFVLNNTLPETGVVAVRFSGVGVAGFSRNVDMNGGNPPPVRTQMMPLEATGFSVDETTPVFTGLNGVTVVAEPGSVDDGTGAFPSERLSFAAGATELDAAVPGSSQSSEGNGTPLGPVGVFAVEITGESGTDYTEFTTPLTVTVPIASSQQGAFEVGDMVPMYSYDAQVLDWANEGMGEVVNMGGGQLGVQAQIDHLSWWGAFQPIDDHACFTVPVQNPSGGAVTDAWVEARARTYPAVADPQPTTGDGIADLTVLRSGDETHEVDVFAVVGDLSIAHPDNPITTPTAEGSCIRGENCPDACTTLSPITLDWSGTVSGTVTDIDGDPVEGALVASTQGRSTHSAADGTYSMPALVGEELSVFSAGVFEEASPVAAGGTETVDLTLISLPALASAVRVDGVTMSFGPCIEGSSQSNADYTCEASTGFFDFEDGFTIEVDASDPEGDPVTIDYTGGCSGQTGAPNPPTPGLDCDPTTGTSSTCTPVNVSGLSNRSCFVVATVSDGTTEVGYRVTVNEEL